MRRGRGARNRPTRRRTSYRAGDHESTNAARQTVVLFASQTAQKTQQLFLAKGRAGVASPPQPGTSHPDLGITKPNTPLFKLGTCCPFVALWCCAS